MDSSLDPESVVQRQLEAYNAKDLDALVAVYADEAEMFEHPAKLLAKGKGELRPRFAERFKEANLHAKLQQRIVMGSIVIDHELVTRTFPEGPGTIELVMTYRVANGRIAQAWMMAGPKTLAK
jgi:hypothetical protein